MVLLESFKVPLGTEAHDFDLTGIDDRKHSLNELKGKKGTVIVFMCNHCPYVQAQWKRLINLQEKYKDKGINFVGINANYNPDYPEDSFENMKKYYSDFEMNFPYLLDETQKVARAYKAQCTPDIFVYDSNLKLVYHGRIDDNWRDPDKATKHDLDEALASLSDNKIPDEDQVPTMGCSIKWR